ncbi:hypothetical protein M231_04768 [Tremella mesenterica]|uniref:Uncharacterized protein n=1 Tax=Tremella mesenterica TaxID=5217 RepID=A0A4Q1BKA5_TREME|nr:hypothetical protein M231_04768 [Tremella mesenterica]
MQVTSVPLPRQNPSNGDSISRSLEENPAGPSRLSSSSPGRPKGRKASKSVSSGRPSMTVPNKRTKTIHPELSLRLTLPSDNSSAGQGVKRRTSTPHLGVKFPIDSDEEDGDDQSLGLKEVKSRARSTSTSIVVPDQLPHPTISPVRTLSPIATAMTSVPTWTDIYVTPASPDSVDPRNLPPSLSSATSMDTSPSVLSGAYNIGEKTVMKIATFFRPPQYRAVPHRRGSDGDIDSEKGLDGSEEDGTVDSTLSTTRTSEDSLRRPGKYWGLWGSNEADHSDDEASYFSLPPTPPEEKDGRNDIDFGTALRTAGGLSEASLPTPALSARSLSRGDSKKRKMRWSRDKVENGEAGWLRSVLGAWFTRGTSSGKTGEVLRELGWTVGILVGMFFITAALALWMIRGMPITQLKHLPSSTTDLQLLSAEIRAYMTSSDIGYWHTVAVLTFVGCWKHAWSVPGAVILNILVGSVLEPFPALFLLTIITASGSLGSYLLSRPLAPLIAVLFPKPLALVRAALAPESIPSPPSSAIETDTITPIQVSSDPSVSPMGGVEAKPNVWRRLLIMRAMGFVPWSGMNVACGVVGVDWKVFWLTTAAGSASWSYVTASVGNILSRLNIPTSGTGTEFDGQGESLTALLRDPMLIGKLVILTCLTLLPVVLKRRTSSPSTKEYEMTTNDTIESLGAPSPTGHRLRALRSLRLAALVESPSSPPMSPLTQSLARFTPTPRAFDLLSFGRAAARQGGRMVLTGIRSTGEKARRMAGSITRS